MKNRLIILLTIGVIASIVAISFHLLLRNDVKQFELDKKTMKKIGTEIALYRWEHNGEYPQSVKCLGRFSDQGYNTSRVTYLAPINQSDVDTDHAVIAFMRPSHQGWDVIVLANNGEVALISNDEFRKHFKDSSELLFVEFDGKNYKLSTHPH